MHGQSSQQRLTGSQMSIVLRLKNPYRSKVTLLPKPPSPAALSHEGTCPHPTPQAREVGVTGVCPPSQPTISQLGLDNSTFQSSCQRLSSPPSWLPLLKPPSFLLRTVYSTLVTWRPTSSLVILPPELSFRVYDFPIQRPLTIPFSSSSTYSMVKPNS